ncbi:MAG: hypothetical protein AB2556_26175 [Candidatus Thiodiazotropha sp.]
MPKSRDQACSVIGKFTQGSKAYVKRLTRRLVTYRRELDFLVRDTRLLGTLVGAPMKCELGHILTYYDGSQPQFTHLRASRLAYASMVTKASHLRSRERCRTTGCCGEQMRRDYHEEVLADHRAKEPALIALKREIRLQTDRVQCQAMRKALPACLGWDRFMEAWKPGDLILTSRQKVRDRAQQLLFERHREAFPQEPVPLLYRPKDTRRQNIMVPIPSRPNQEELLLNDVVEVPLKYIREVLGGKWGSDSALGYAITQAKVSHRRPTKSLDHR